MHLSVAFLGDTVGSVGRTAATKAAKKLREQGVQLVIANGENSRNGSGLSPDNLRELLRGGIDAVTLGDHWAKDRQIVPFLDDPEQPVSRPANLSLGAPGKRIVRLATPGGSGGSGGGGPPLYVLTVLGRLFMPLSADSPFAAIDREISAIPERDAMVLVEIHAEATSEKQAIAWHCLRSWSRDEAPRVVAVLGTHTHVATADARLLDHVLAAQTDVGMCGPHRSVIGRDVSATLDAMVRQMPAPLEVASEDVRAQGAIIRIDVLMRRAAVIEMIDMAV